MKRSLQTSDNRVCSLFQEFYGLRQKAFGVTPDSRSLYLSPTHREALASLAYGIESGRGFLALIARPGMGKTTLLFQLLERLQTSTRTAFLFQTQCDSRELLHYLLVDLGFDTHGQEMVAMHNQLNEGLARGVLEGKQFVLIIDEAHNLDDSVLETIRLLSDFETPRQKLLQIVLAGQPQLAKKLLRPSLAQLRQRIAIVSRLEPFSHEEVVRYINDRLRVAGYVGGPLFTPDALEMITSYSEGIPRNINNLCFNALSLGCALQRRTIDPNVVREVIADLDLSPLVEETFHQAAAGAPLGPKAPSQLKKLRNFASRAFRPVALAATVILAGVFSLSSLRGNGGKTPLRTTPAPIQAARVSPGPELPTLRPAPMPAATSSASWPKAGEEAHSEASPEETFTIVVGPKQTLRRISRRYFGRFDPQLVEQIAALNPQLKDPRRLRAGQSLRLPMPPKRQERTSPSNSKDELSARGKQRDE